MAFADTFRTGVIFDSQVKEMGEDMNFPYYHMSSAYLSWIFTQIFPFNSREHCKRQVLVNSKTKRRN